MTTKPVALPDLLSTTRLPTNDAQALRKAAAFIRHAEALAEEARELAPLLRRLGLESALPCAGALADEDLLGGLVALAWTAEEVSSKLNNAGSVHLSALLGDDPGEGEFSRRVQECALVQVGEAEAAA